MIDIKTKTTVEQKHYIELDRCKFVTLLRQAGVDLPYNAGIFMQIPGGGNWSNTPLDIDDAHLQIHYTTTDES